MTLEKLCSLDWAPEEIAKLSDAELLKILEPKLKITRPELADKPVRVNGSRTMRDYERNSKIGKAKSIADKFGIDLEGLFDD